ncbi:MAG: putative addiction module antidote protein [Azoarcus sp.]|nr:putative addiction module antidote protein [Azoarcus sp.]
MRKTSVRFLRKPSARGRRKILSARLALPRGKGMTEIARQAGVTRASLYKSLSAGGNPEFSTVAKVARALGLKLTVVPA